MSPLVLHYFSRAREWDKMTLEKKNNYLNLIQQMAMRKRELEIAPFIMMMWMMKR